MGLPSGVQWASCNVGAAKPADLGLYFSWGNIEGHRLGEEYDFSRAVYDSTPAAAIDTDLSLSQDAARANLGEPWRMPTAAEFRELFNNCTIEWTTVNGINGSLFTSNINGNTLFFPAAGFYNSTALVNRSTTGYYWSSTFASDEDAKRMFLSDSGVDPQSNSKRYFGFSVRAVLDPT